MCIVSINVERTIMPSATASHLHPSGWLQVSAPTYLPVEVKGIIVFICLVARLLPDEVKGIYCFT